jgi:DNA-binding MarR family transcriptional regulator
VVSIACICSYITIMSRAAEATASTAPGCNCLRLRKAARRVSQIYDRHLAPHDLTVTQYSLLGHVKAHDGVGIGALAEMLVMDPTTLTRNLRPIERQGLLVMAPDTRDRRNRNLHLTEAGRQRFAAARPSWLAAQRQIDEILGAEDGARLAAVIDRMLERLA